MWKLFFKSKAEDQLIKIDKTIQIRIKAKLVFFASQEKPLIFARKLKNSKLGSYRFRIWEYRIIFDIDKQGRIIIIALIGSRKDIYK